MTNVHEYRWSYNKQVFSGIHEHITNYTNLHQCGTISHSKKPQMHIYVVVKNMWFNLGRWEDEINIMLCEVQPFVDVPKYNIKYQNLKLHLVLLGICLAALKLKHNICYKLRFHTNKKSFKNSTCSLCASKPWFRHDVFLEIPEYHTKSDTQICKPNIKVGPWKCYLVNFHCFVQSQQQIYCSLSVSDSSRVSG